MLFHVLRQRREGRVIPRHTMHIDADRVRGELRVSDGRDPLLRRSCRVARLVDPARLVADVLPPLKDATLLYVDHTRLVLTGFEQVLERDYAQTWMLAMDPEELHAMHPIGGDHRW
jgi:hypothetical protein